MSASVTMFKADEHYDLVAAWWKVQGWPVIPLDHLPQLGFIALIDEKPAAAAWLYQTDSKFCLFEWLVANPEVRREPRAEAIAAIIGEAKRAATEMGFGTIFMSATNESLISRLRKAGFQESDRNMTNLTYRIGG